MTKARITTWAEEALTVATWEVATFSDITTTSATLTTLPSQLA